MIKVLHMIDSLSVGGAEKLLVTYAEQAASTEIQTYFISLQEKNKSHIVSELENLGASVHYDVKAKLFSFSRFFRLYHLVKNGKFDLLHTHLTYANILGIMIARILGVPVVATMHNVLSGRQKSSPVEKMELLLLHFATKIIGVGEKVATDYRKLFPEKVVFIANAVSIQKPLSEEERITLREQLVCDAAYPILVAVGRLTYQKGFSDLVSAFSLVHERFPLARLLVAGEGDMRVELEEQTRALGLQEHLLWLGIRDDVPQLLAASDIYVSAAKWEGLSIALLEAMAARLALVVTEVGDAAEVIVPGSGVLVPPEKPEALALEICSLLQEPSRMQALGEAAYQRICDAYSAGNWFRKLYTLYEQVVLEASS